MSEVQVMTRVFRPSGPRKHMARRPASVCEPAHFQTRQMFRKPFTMIYRRTVEWPERAFEYVHPEADSLITDSSPGHGHCHFSTAATASGSGSTEETTSALNDSSTAPPSDTSVPRMTLPPNTSCSGVSNRLK